jgi:hypothetical protein
MLSLPCVLSDESVHFTGAYAVSEARPMTDILAEVE